MTESLGELCNRNLVRALEITHRMRKLADQGEADGCDDGCAVLFGVIRDCAFKIRGRAEHEIEMHRRRGRWDERSKE